MENIFLIYNKTKSPSLILKLGHICPILKETKKYKKYNKEFKSLILKETTNNIIDQIPNKEEYIKNRLKNILKSIPYTAPEVLDIIIKRLYILLIKEIPVKKNNEKWELNIMNIFNNYCINQKLL